jgi:hypothetical protein
VKRIGNPVFIAFLSVVCGAELDLFDQSSGVDMASVLQLRDEHAYDVQRSDGFRIHCVPRFELSFQS